jgi:hypothetical protein
VARNRRQIRRINERAAGLKLADITAAQVLHDLSDRLEMTARTGREEAARIPRDRHRGAARIHEGCGPAHM